VKNIHVGNEDSLFQVCVRVNAERFRINEEQFTKVFAVDYDFSCRRATIDRLLIEFKRLSSEASKSEEPKSLQQITADLTLKRKLIADQLAPLEWLEEKLLAELSDEKLTKEHIQTVREYLEEEEQKRLSGLLSFHEKSNALQTMRKLQIEFEKLETEASDSVKPKFLIVLFELMEELAVQRNQAEELIASLEWFKLEFPKMRNAKLTKESLQTTIETLENLELEEKKLQAESLAQHNRTEYVILRPKIAEDGSDEGFYAQKLSEFKKEGDWRALLYMYQLLTNTRPIKPPQ
jgi:hypothetical protein